MVTGINPTVTLQAGSNTITLVVNDGTQDSSPDNVVVTITDFALGVSPASATVRPGQSATYTLAVSPQFGAFDRSVSFSCSGQPSLSSCSFSPTSTTPGASPANVSLTISTTAPSAILRPPQEPFNQWPVYLACIAFLLCLMWAWARQQPSLVTARALIQLTLVFVLLVLQTACGGGGAVPLHARQPQGQGPRPGPSRLR